MEHSKRKWKVLIADDEQMIIKLIISLIPWDELNLELASTASNGLEAIEYLKNNDADILITDARMPECDGIELIKWCHQQKKEMRYIVISGFRHFEYAHGAIQYGVDSYLLKPINQEELIENLKLIINKLEEKRREKSKASEMKAQPDLNRDRMRRHFISSYVFDGKEFLNREIDSVDYINEEYQLNFAEGIYRAIFVKLDDTKNTSYRLGSFLDKIKEEAEAMWAEYITENIGCSVHSGVMFFLNYQEEQRESLKRDIEALLAKCEKMVDTLDGIRVTIGVSCAEKSLHGIRHCMVTAVDAIKYRLYLPHVPVIYYDDYSYKIVPVSSIWTVERSNLLENYLRTGNEKGIQKLLFDLKMEIHKDKNISPVVLYDVARTIQEEVERVFSTFVRDEDEKAELFEKYLTELDNTETVDGIGDCLSHMCRKSIEIIEREMKQQEIQPIRMIRQYIDEHFSENISLDDLADKVQLSKNYVSAIFRKETGVNFLDFLTSKRIDEAAKLLRKSTMSISEIAEKVGYSDVKYFSKLCKKNLGMSPSEYRKLYS